MRPVSSTLVSYKVTWACRNTRNTTGFVEVHLIHGVYECGISDVVVSNVSFFNGYNVSI